MTLTKKISIALILVVSAALGVWAIVVGANDVSGDEVSVVLLEWSTWYKSLPLAFGVLMGHWVWPVKTVTFGKWRYFVLVGLVLASILSDVFVSYFTVFPLIPFVVGVFAGHWLWPQKERSVR